MDNLSEGWSRYWQSGHRHSCPTSFQGFYGDATQRFWGRQFARFDCEDCIADLGCGNAALLHYWATTVHLQALPELHGVDLAQLQSEQLCTAALPSDRRQRIQVHDQTDFAHMCFSDHSLTGVVSQFALEYANTDAVWQELARVLAPSSQLALVLHQHGSLLYQVARDEQVICAAVLGEGGVLQQALALLPYVAMSHTQAGRQTLQSDTQAASVRLAFNQASESLQILAHSLEHSAYAEEILQQLVGVLSGSRPEGVTGSQQQLVALREQLHAHEQRLQALCQSALDEAGMDTLQQRLRTMGFAVGERQTLEEQGHAFAWAIEANR